MPTEPMLIKRSSIRGFTLLEVLISVLILSIGLLGLASLQVAGMRNNHSAYLRSQATLLAYDIADRMRANMVGVTAGNYNSGAGTGTPVTPSEDTNCLSTTGCLPPAMAAHDLFEWNAALLAQLPNGVGVTCVDSTPGDGVSGTPACDYTGNLYVIKIWWTDDRDGTPKRFTTSFQP